MIGACIIACVLSTGEPPAWAYETLDELGSVRHARREAASLRLLESPDLSLTDIEALLREPGLSPEQRLRLLLVAEIRFRSSPRAAIGIQLGGVGEGPPSVTNLIPGFDARQKLAVGDTILTIAGEPIDSLERLRTVIISHEPGTAARIVIRRNGVEREVDVILGAFDNLGNARIRDSELGEAWAFRLRRGGISRGETALPSGVLPGQWDTARPQSPGAADRHVVVGGLARSQPGRFDGVLLDGPLEGDAEARRQELKHGLTAELEQIDLSIARVRRTIELQTDALNRKDLDEEKREQLSHAIEVNRANLEAYELRRDRLVSLLRTLRGD